MITRLTADRVLRITVPDFGEFRIPVDADAVAVEFMPTALRAEMVTAGTKGSSEPIPTVYGVDTKHLAQPIWKFTATITRRGENETQ